MQEVFRNLLEASLSGSVVILAIIALRMVLKKAPRSVFCLLWLLAGVRLMLPFKIESSFSLQPEYEEVTQSIVQQMEVPEAIPDYTQEREEILDTESEILVQPQQPEAVTQPQIESTPVWNWNRIIPWIWATGIAVLCGASLLNYWNLKRRVREAWLLDNGCWECAGIETAFVLGFLPPKIYLPTGLSEKDRDFIFSHENTHIARHDHWYKLLGYMVLAVHWFNPLVWLAYNLLCRDIELACDEHVVRYMNVEQRKAYSAALLSCSSRHARLAACPVAFGESDPKQRILSVLNYRKPGFWVSLAAVAAVVFVAVCLMTSPKAEFLDVDIPSLTYTDSAKSYKVTEWFNPAIMFNESTKDYESGYATYHFDARITEEDRDACVFYSDGILSRMALEEKPEIIVIDEYDGAWVDEKYLYIGGDFASIDYGAKLIVLLSGGYANYGVAYGYADYIAVAEGWKEATDEAVQLTNNAARDLNWLCFREKFVSDGEIEINQNVAIRFAREYIAENGEAAFQQLIRKSGDVNTVEVFNRALYDWYAANGLEYTPSEVLYSIGGEYHEYLVKCAYATFYLPQVWDNGWTSPLTMDENFLHESYEEVKYCFETNVAQMSTLQARLGFAEYNNDLAVEFMMEELSVTNRFQNLIRINSVEDLMMQYVFWLVGNPYRVRADLFPGLDDGMAQYLAVTSPNVYMSEWLRYSAEHGMRAAMYQQGEWNALFTQMMEGITDAYTIQKARWDFGTYYFDDYYDDPGAGRLTSFPLYLIEKYGYETMFDYIYQTDAEPIEIDFYAEQEAWVEYLEEKYAEYPKYSDYEPDVYARIATKEVSEEELLEKCRTALEEYQSQEIYALMIEWQFSGPNALNDGSTQICYGNGDDWLRQSLVSGMEPSGEEWHLVKDGKKFSRYIYTFDNPAHGESSDTGWVEGFQDGEGQVSEPWLRTFDWDNHEITFVEHKVERKREGDAELITFIVQGSPHNDEYVDVLQYQVTFVFNGNSELQKVLQNYTQTWPMWSDGEETTGTIYVSAAMSLDVMAPEDITALIDVKYQEAADAQ